MNIDDLHKQHFTTRQTISEANTAALMELLHQKGHFNTYRQATTEEDKGGIDWWTTYTPEEEKETTIQFKLRDKQRDVPVVRFQPFHGIDKATTVDGRDWRGLRDKVSDQYYVGIRDANKKYFVEVYRVSCAELWVLAEELYNEWLQAEKTNPAFFTADIVKIWCENCRDKCVFYGSKGGQIWWKKNRNEGSPKFNMYIPYDCKNWSYSLTNEDALLVSNMAAEILKKGASCLKT